MKTLRLTAMLCIALLTTMMGCSGLEEPEPPISSGDVHVVNGKRLGILDWQTWRAHQTLRFEHKYWKHPWHFDIRFHGNACEHWKPDWVPYDETEGKRIRSHVLTKPEHRLNFETDKVVYDKETGKRIHVHCTDFGEHQAKPDFVYETNVILNHKNRWNTPYYREYRDGAFWIHANNCPNGWKTYWQPYWPQAIKWLDLRAEVWEKERYPWRVAEGWTMEQKMRDNGRRVHIHCSTPRRTP